MKLSDAMIERALASWYGAPAQTQDGARMRAALEAALSECCVETVEATEGPYGEYGVILTEPEMIGKRVALVLLEDEV